MFDIE